jgi:hypothetical protein
MEKTILLARSKAQQVSDWIACTAGSGPVLVLHVVWFSALVTVNAGVVRGIRPFDPFPFPFPFMTMTVSLEAISWPCLFSPVRTASYAKPTNGVISTCRSICSQSARLRCCSWSIYAPAGPPLVAIDGSLEHFLTERYRLYHVNRRGAPYRLEIHHTPWPLQPADADVVRNNMAAASGIALPARTPLPHCVIRQDMVA